jgi:hypothetical protein
MVDANMAYDVESAQRMADAGCVHQWGQSRSAALYVETFPRVRGNKKGALPQAVNAPLMPCGHTIFTGLRSRCSLMIYRGIANSRSMSAYR